MQYSKILAISALFAISGMAAPLAVADRNLVARNALLGGLTNSITDSYNKDNSKTTKDSYNDNSQTDKSKNIHDSYNDNSKTDKSVNDSYNDKSTTDKSTNDSYNDNSKTENSYNTDKSDNSDNSVNDSYNDNSKDYDIASGNSLSKGYGKGDKGGYKPSYGSHY